MSAAFISELHTQISLACDSLEEAAVAGDVAAADSAVNRLADLEELRQRTSAENWETSLLRS
jgi:hypothetical protein